MREGLKSQKPTEYEQEKKKEMDDHKTKILKSMS